MRTFFINHSIEIRLLSFLSILIIMGIWEKISPKRKLSAKKLSRWKNNLSLVILDTILVKIILPISGVAFAIFVQNRKLGLFNLINLSELTTIILSILILDFIIYFQHKTFHTYRFLWKFHKVHHTDLDIDTTTGIRFHPIEIIISMLIKLLAILIFGIPAIGFILFEILLNSIALFNHANIHINSKIDKMIRLFLVTPDMHRVHHSIIMKETNSNYGFNLSWWDYLIKTYRSQPEKGHIGMTIGLKEYRDEEELGLGSLLIIPFEKRE